MCKIWPEPSSISLLCLASSEGYGKTHIHAGLSEPSLLVYSLRTKILCLGSLIVGYLLEA